MFSLKVDSDDEENWDDSWFVDNDDIGEIDSNELINKNNKIEQNCCNSNSSNVTSSVRNKTCELCKKRPSFNYPIERTSRFCANHKLEGMVNEKERTYVRNKCVFCSQYLDNKNNNFFMVKSLHKTYSHLLCALYSNDVYVEINPIYQSLLEDIYIYLNKDTKFNDKDIKIIENHIKLVDETIRNSKRLKCKECHKVGASLCCSRRSCSNIYHVNCAFNLCSNPYSNDGNYFVFHSKMVVNTVSGTGIKKYEIKPRRFLICKDHINHSDQWKQSCEYLSVLLDSNEANQQVSIDIAALPIDIAINIMEMAELIIINVTLEDSHKECK
jgi:hypothetical protein